MKNVESPMQGWLQVLLVVYSALCLTGTLAYLLCGQENLLSKLMSNDQNNQLNTHIFLATALVGFATAAIHNLASLSIHAGRGDLGKNWTVFYICRPFTGAGVALVTALIMVSGIAGFSVDTGTGPNSTSPGSVLIVLTWAALAGLFSQPALDKLQEIFDVMFRVKKPSGREEKGKNGDDPSSKRVIPGSGSDDDGKHSGGPRDG